MLALHCGRPCNLQLQLVRLKLYNWYPNNHVKGGLKYFRSKCMPEVIGCTKSGLVARHSECGGGSMSPIYIAHQKMNILFQPISLKLHNWYPNSHVKGELKYYRGKCMSGGARLRRRSGLEPWHSERGGVPRSRIYIAPKKVNNNKPRPNHTRHRSFSV